VGANARRPLCLFSVAFGPARRHSALGHCARMYSMDNLLHLVHSDGADELRLHIGRPPVIVLDGEQQPMEGPPITAEEAQQLLQSITDTRQTRDLREHGWIEFIHKFRGRASFVVRAKMEDEGVSMVIH